MTRPTHRFDSANVTGTVTFALSKPNGSGTFAVRVPPAALLLGVVAALNLIGLVMVLSASSVQSLRDYGSSWYVFGRQAAWVVVGAIAMVAAARTPYRHWRRLALPLLAVALCLMVMVFVPGIGVRVSGSARWLGWGPLRIQPAELAKLGLLLFTADLLARRSDRMANARETFWPVIGFFAAVGLLLVAQPDLGTMLVTGAITVTLLFLAGTPLPRMTGLVAVAAVGTFLLAKVEPYRWARMTSFLDPFADAGNTGYQAAQGRVALAAGGLFGSGLGASRAKWGFLPAAHTDFIFAILGEELGLIGALVVLSLYTVLAVVIIGIGRRAPDRFASLVVGGVAAWIVGQAVINVGAVVGLLPITGVPLPFMSAGGSSLVPMMAAIGIVLCVERTGRAALRSKSTRQPRALAS